MSMEDEIKDKEIEGFLKFLKVANETIKRLTNGEKIDFNTLVRTFKKEGIENFVVTKKEYIETVLNMLKEKDKEIEKYKYLYQKALDNTVSADRENINLKKQIKEMAKYIAKEDKTEKFCDYKTVCDQNCEECVEAYFRESE